MFNFPIMTSFLFPYIDTYIISLVLYHFSRRNVVSNNEYIIYKLVPIYVIRIFASPYQASHKDKILTFQLTFIPKRCSKSQLELHAKTYSLDDMNKLLYIHRLDS